MAAITGNRNEISDKFTNFYLQIIFTNTISIYFKLYFQAKNQFGVTNGWKIKASRRGGVLHYGVRWGCAPVLGSFWRENSKIGINFYWKISVIGVYFHLEFSVIGVYC